MDTLRPRCPFYPFFMDLGSLPGPTLGTFSRFSVIWDDRKENRSKVHDFGGRGMEIILECNGCMCHNRFKKPCVLGDFTFFHLFSSLVSRGVVLGYIWDSFW